MNKHSPSVTFYRVDVEGGDPFITRDRAKLMKFLATEGTDDMKVSANGENVTFQIARELATESGQSGEYASGYDTVFSEFAQYFAPDRCDEMWAEIERDHDEWRDEMKSSNWGKWA